MPRQLLRTAFVATSLVFCAWTGLGRGRIRCAAADVIKLKSLMVRQDIPKEDWLSGDVIDHIEALARDCMPLLTFAEPAR